MIHASRLSLSKELETKSIFCSTNSVKKSRMYNSKARKEKTTSLPFKEVGGKEADVNYGIIICAMGMPNKKKRETMTYCLLTVVCMAIFFLISY